MKRFLIGIIICILLPIEVNATEINYQNYFPTENVYVRENEKFNCCEVFDNENNKILLAYNIINYAVATEKFNIYATPNIYSTVIGTVFEGMYILEVARSSTGWSIVVIDNQWAFMWTKNIEPTNECDCSQVTTTSSELKHLTYLGKWTVTEYCTRCNSCGKRTTASGKTATEFLTAAVCYSNYKQLKGKTLYVEGWGEFEVQDWGRVYGCNKQEWIDLFLPTSYHNSVWEKCNIYIVE